jgi:transcriptional regulator with XRE-family HTH domain
MSDGVAATTEVTPEQSLGARIREFRLARRMSLRALALLTRTSPGFLSQLERAQANASVSTLRKLADGLGITLPDLFSDDDVNSPKILRRDHRPEIHASNLTSKYLLSQKPLRNLEVYVADFLPGGSSGDAYVHGDAQEMVVVISGSVTLELAGAEHQLNLGDSAEYRTSTLHAIHNRSAAPAEVIWIISPPTLGVPQTTTD